MRILDPKIEEFPCLVNKLSLLLTTLIYRPLKNGVKNIQAVAYSSVCLVLYMASLLNYRLDQRKCNKFPPGKVGRTLMITLSFLL